ncbi:nitroreductase, partial [bacterium]|nr:nitroreductase [bacterium]
MSAVSQTNSVIDLLLTRRSLVAAKITQPGPSPEELEIILRCATRVPDHGKLTPWHI